MAKKYLAAIIITAAVVMPVFASWDGYRGNQARTGYNPDDETNLSGMVKAYSVQVSGPGPNLSQPVVSGSYVYLGTHEGRILKIAINNGVITGSQIQTGGPIISTGIIVNATLYIASMDGFIYAVNTGDMTITWKRKATGGISASPLLLNDIIYFIDTNGKVNAYNLNGDLQGNGLDMLDYVPFSPAMSNNAVIAADSGKVVCADMQAGTELNAGYLDSSPAFGPVMKNDLDFFIAAENKSISVFTLLSGAGIAPLSSYTTANMLNSPLAFNSTSGTLVSSVNHGVYLNSYIDFVDWHDSAAPVPIATVMQNYNFPGGVAVGKNKVFVPCYNNVITQYNADGTGKMVFTTASEGQVNTSLFLNNAMLLYDNKGFLHFYGPQINLDYPPAYSLLNVLPYSPVPINGTVIGPYNLHYYNPASGDVVLSSGTASITEGKIYDWDITSLLDGVYELKLDVNGFLGPLTDMRYVSKGNFRYAGNLPMPEPYGWELSLPRFRGVAFDSFGNKYAQNYVHNSGSEPLESKIFTCDDTLQGESIITQGHFDITEIVMQDDNTLWGLASGYMLKIKKMEDGQWQSAPTEFIQVTDFNVLGYCGLTYYQNKLFVAMKTGYTDSEIRAYDPSVISGWGSMAGLKLISFGSNSPETEEYCRIGNPSGICISNGMIFISDIENNVIHVFNAENYFYCYSIGQPANVTENGPGRLWFASDVSVGADGLLYVTEGYDPNYPSRGNRIQVFTQNGESVAIFGNGGDFPGYFNDPSRTDIDANNIIYVSDTGNKKIQRFESFVDVPKVKITEPVNGLLHDNHTIEGYTFMQEKAKKAGFSSWKLEYCESRIPRPSPTIIVSSVQEKPYAGGLTAWNISGVDDNFYALRLVMTDTLGREFSNETIASKGLVQYKWKIGGTTGVKDGAFYNLIGTAKIGNKIFVADKYKMVEYDETGKFIKNSINIADANARDMLLYNNGTNYYLYIAHYGASMISIIKYTYDANQDIWNKDTSPPFSTANVLLVPYYWDLATYTCDMEIVGNNLFLMCGSSDSGAPYFTDNNDGRVHKLLINSADGSISSNPADMTADMLNSLPKTGGIAFDSAGKMYLPFTGQNTVKVYDVSGVPTVVATMAANSPIDVKFGQNDMLYVLERENAGVKVMTTTGTEVYHFGRNGQGEGSFFFPYKINIFENDDIYVCDAGNTLVQRFNSYIVMSVPTLTVTPTITETITETSTPTATLTMTETVTQTVTKTDTETVTGTVTRTVTETTTKTITQTVTVTVTKTRTETVTETVTETGTETVTGTVTGTATRTATGTVTKTVTGTVTQTTTGTATETVTGTITRTDTETVTETITETVTGTVTETVTGTVTETATTTVTETVTETATGTVTETVTKTTTGTVTETVTGTGTPTVTETITQTATETTTKTITGTVTETATETVTQTVTETVTVTPTTGILNISFGGSGIDTAKSICPDGNGGYALSGFTTSYGNGGFETFLIKTDLNGNNQTWKTYGGIENEQSSFVTKATDGGYLMTGYWMSNYPISGTKLSYILKTDSTGTERSMIKMPSRNAQGSTVKELAGGGYIHAWSNGFYSGSEYDGINLTRLDAAGGILWTQPLYGTECSALEIRANGYIVVGYANTQTTNEDVYVAVTDLDGIVTNSPLIYDGPYNDRFTSIAAADGGGFIIVGYTNSYSTGNYDVLVAKVDDNGFPLWLKLFGGTGNDRAYSITAAGNDRYLIAGETSSYGAGYSDLYVLKIDGNGNELGSRTYGGTNIDRGYSIIKDGEYFVAAGDSQSFNSDYFPDVYMVKDLIFGDTPVPTVIITPLPTATPGYETAWPQYAMDSEKSSQSRYMAGLPDTLANSVFEFLAPAPEVGNIVLDNANNAYFMTYEQYFARIFKLGQDGEPVNIYTTNGPTYSWSNGNVVLGKYDHLYYSERQDSVFFGLKALNTETFSNDWQISPFFPSSWAVTDAIGGIYVLALGIGIKKIRDNGPYAEFAWDDTVRGTNTYMNPPGADRVIDSGLNVYFSDPYAVLENPPGNFTRKGLRLLKYVVDGLPSPLSYIVSTDGNEYCEHLMINEATQKIYMLVNNGAGKQLHVIKMAGLSFEEIVQMPEGTTGDMAIQAQTNNLVFIGGANRNKIYKCAESAGGMSVILLFTTPYNEPITSPLVSDADGRILFGTGNGVYALLNSAEPPKWISPVPGGIKHICVGENSNVFFVNGSNMVNCVGLSTPVATPPSYPSAPVPGAAISLNGVELTCNALATPGMVGCNFYKAGSPYELLNSEGPVCSYLDTDVAPGETYSYLVTGIDSYDQESAPSDPITVLFATVTLTVTPSDTATVTPSMTPTVTPTMAVLLSYKAGDTGSSTASPHPMFRLQNSDLRPLDLVKITIKYWYSFEGAGQTEIAVVDYAGRMPQGMNITGNTALQIIPGDFNGGQDRCLTASFDAGAGVLAAGEYADINTRFNKSDWSQYDQINDWSFGAYADYTPWDRVAVYYEGVKIWGLEPVPFTATPTVTETPTFTETPSASPTDSVSPTYSCTKTQTGTYTASATGTITDTVTGTFTPSYTATFTATETITPSITDTMTETATETLTPTDTESRTASISETMTATPTAPPVTPALTFTISPTPTQPQAANLSLKFKASVIGQYTNSPHPEFRVHNAGQEAIDLSRIEVRYWYGFEGSGQAEQALVDYAGRMPSGTNIGSSTIAAITQGSFSAGQDRYLKITFNSGAGSIAANEYAEIKTRFNKSDWSNYDQANDYSYAAYADFTNWEKVTVYLDGALVWGHEPGWIGPAYAKSTPGIESLSESSVYSYPNPSIDETTIRFPLQSPQAVKIVILDPAGGVVRIMSLKAPETVRGINRVIWDNKNNLGIDAANGVYILRVITAEKTILKKIAVVR